MRAEWFSDIQVQQYIFRSHLIIPVSEQQYVFPWVLGHFSSVGSVFRLMEQALIPKERVSHSLSIWATIAPVCLAHRSLLEVAGFVGR